MKRFARCCLAAVASTLLPTAAFAEGQASSGFRISLTVPEVCHIETSPVSVDETSGQASTSIFEMCNADRGFVVMASYRTLESGEQVQLNYDGETTQLDGSGISEVAHRNGPILGDVPVLIQTSGLVGGLTISLGMMPV